MGQAVSQAFAAVGGRRDNMPAAGEPQALCRLSATSFHSAGCLRNAVAVAAVAQRLGSTFNVCPAEWLTIPVTTQKIVAVAIVVVFTYEMYEADRVVARVREDAV